MAKQTALFPIFTTEYYVNDPVSFGLALFSLVPIILVPCYLFYFLALYTHTHRSHPMVSAALKIYLPGCLVNAALNYALKKTIAVNRPLGFFASGRQTGHKNNSFLVSGGKEGMPSHHAQLMAYLIFVAFKTRLFALGRIRLFFLSIITLALVCLSRVYHSFHSWDQVLAGSFVGYLFGIIFVEPLAQRLIHQPYQKSHVSHSPDE